MNTEFIKKLRETLDIPLNKALSLAKMHGEDIVLCQEAFREEQVRQIMAQTECDHDQAVAYLQRFNDPQKAIEAIQNQVYTLAVVNVDYHEPYGFQLWAETENGEIYKGNRYAVFVPFSHFEKYLLADFKEFFSDEDEMAFDVTGTNFFNKLSIEKIIKKLNEKSFEKENERQFVQNIIDWLSEKINIAPIIVVNGTL